MLFGELQSFSVARHASGSQFPSSFSLGRRLCQADLLGIPAFEETPGDFPAEQPSGFSLTVTVIGGHLATRNAADAGQVSPTQRKSHN